MENTISFNTKFGWISATENKNKVTKIKFCKLKRKGVVTKVLKKLRKSVLLYCDGKAKKIKVPIKITGNKLQKKIWWELKKIQLGKTRSYGQIAKKLKLSARYVGRVCGENKHVLIIPCHRVIRSDGSLGGFSAPTGIKLKKKLIKFEEI
tara:strand:+ start:287 stop:736 length:450 start_codon:yes stop_codon:yes gene_type:complete